MVAEADAEEKLTIANNLIQDWDAFLKMTEEYAGNNRLPFPYITYVKEMDKRVRALAAKLVTSVGAAMVAGE
jgi:2-oxo-4-hydroxy-4-carboxy--5-ureidoimidazoline (OHCU) decarboxylase